MRVCKIMNLFCWAIVIGVLTVARASGAKTDDLYRVRKIYLQTQGEYELSDWGKVAVQRWYSILRPALSNYGFEIVDRPSDADAIMDGEVDPWVTLDGPQPDPPRYSVHFRLTSVRHGATWKISFDIRSRAPYTEVEQRGIERVTHELFTAWKKSAMKAGIRVGNRLP